MYNFKAIKKLYTLFIFGLISIYPVFTQGSEPWRSNLYPEHWQPGYKDSTGRFLHDFSYAGYQQGENNLPEISEPVINVTLPPYNADNTGDEDATAAIQQALDAAGQSGGGVVYLPTGTYKINPSVRDYALRISYDSVILRGAGPDSTFLLNTASYMRQKDLILVQGTDANWSTSFGQTTNLAFDLLHPTQIIPVENVSGFQAGDEIIIRTDVTQEFAEEHYMLNIWSGWAGRVIFQRTIDSIDISKNLLFIDAPTRYFLKKRDNARVHHAQNHLKECGIEQLSIGNIQNNKSGWDEQSYTVSGTGAYEVHGSHIIRLKHCKNSWVKKVYSYKPASNTEDIHVLSNFLLLDQCRNITVDSCYLQKPQYEGGGGNGYMFTLQSNDCLISNSRANHSRHNYDFKHAHSNGNVILNCIGENSKYSSDFHMYLSMSNLIDGFTVNKDYLEASFRPYGGSTIHGYASTQSVFYNTYGQAYHPNRNYIVESRQFAHGYIIGTSGPVDAVKTTPVQGIASGYSYNTSPEDFKEGIGLGESLIPQSLYIDQLNKRNERKGIKKQHVTVEVFDEESLEPLNGAVITLINHETQTTQNGTAIFSRVLPSFHISVQKQGYLGVSNTHYVIHSDTTLRIYLAREHYVVNLTLLHKQTKKPMWGINVTFNNENNNTNEEGLVTYYVQLGTYPYEIIKQNFDTIRGSIQIEDDTTLILYMNQTHADVVFRIKHNENPEKDVQVVLNQDTSYTNTIGYTAYQALPVPDTYHYQLKKYGFTVQQDTFILQTDTVLNLSLIPGTTGTNADNNPFNISIYPNPVDNWLHIKGTQKNQHIRLYRSDGIEILTINNPAPLHAIPTHNYPAGTYFLIIQDKNRQIVTSFIKR